MQAGFSLTPEKAATMHQPTATLESPKRDEVLLVSTTAKHFGILTPTLRHYVQPIAAQSQTPQQSTPGNAFANSQSLYKTHSSVSGSFSGN
jgi:hypothetical protein